jgi:peptidoglycan hydrolase-like protein with peptidoglycan-binding domain
VRTLQKRLNAKGFLVATVGAGSPGNETTFFGPATETAVKKFQNTYGIAPASGVVNAGTRTALESF